MKRTLLRWTGAATLLAGACAPAHPSTASAPDAANRVTVTNTNWLDVNIYALRGGSRARLGTVTALTTETLQVPRSLMPDGTVQLLVDPIGSPNTFTSEGIVVMPGQRIELTVMPAIRMSTLALRAR